MPAPIFPVLPPEGEPVFTELSHNLLHRATALNRLLEQYKDKARLKTLVDIFAEQCQELENVFWDLYVKRTVDDATGDQLRILGRIVGLTKGETADEDFRVLVRAQIRVLKSRGTWKDLLGLIRLVLGTDPSERLFIEVYPAGLLLQLLVVPTFSVVLLARILRAAKAGGVGFASIDYPPPTGDWFTWDNGDEDGDTDLGWMNGAETTGGQFGREVA